MADDWEKNSKYILMELKRNKEDHLRMFDKLDVLITSVTVIKVKAGIIGLLGGVIPVTIMLIVKYLNR